MRESLLEILRCPTCDGQNLVVLNPIDDGHEIRSATAHCAVCGAEYPVESGIVCVMTNPRRGVLDEIEGWSAKVDLDHYDEASHKHQRALLLSLPFVDEYLEKDIDNRRMWTSHGSNFEKFVSKIDLNKKRVLDVGAGRCWSSAAMAGKGAEVVALDILRKLYIGLETADLYIEEKGVYFERVQADMQDLPFGDATFDIVFMTASAHHAEVIGTFLSDVFRVLKSDGCFIPINEPITWKEDAPPPESDEGITENMIGIYEWFRLFKTAGFLSEKFQATSRGRLLNCVLRKRSGKRPITERLNIYRRVLVSVSNVMFWSSIPRAKRMAKRSFLTLKNVVRRIFILLSIPTSPLVLKPSLDYVKVLLFNRGSPPPTVQVWSESGSRWLGTGWYPLDLKNYPQLRRAYRKANLVLAVPRNASCLVINLGIPDNNIFEIPISVGVLMNRKRVATISIDDVGIAPKIIDIPEDIRKRDTIRVSLKTGRILDGEARSRIATSRVLGVLVDQVSACPEDVAVANVGSISRTTP